MNEAMRPFTDEEMWKIIEGERTVVNGHKDEYNNASVGKKGDSRIFRGRPIKRMIGNQRTAKGIDLDLNGTQCDVKLTARACLGSRIPKIPEEREEEEDDGCSIVEPVLRCNNVEIHKRASDETIDVDTQKQRVSSVEIILLEKFQEKQKQMEQQNKMSKELLQKALSDRAKKTREEALKLNHIEEELKKLDNMLSTDVTIIRHQIEMASQEYLEAQKRYDRAEREYIGAKMNLYNFKEKKELLTSHLCTIIEKNELRKAQKLSDLMRKLEMGVDISQLTLSDDDMKVTEDKTNLKSAAEPET